METEDRDICDPDIYTVVSNLSRDMLNHELPSLSPVSIGDYSQLDDLLWFCVTLGFWLIFAAMLYVFTKKEPKPIHPWLFS